MANTGLATVSETYLDLINDKLSGLVLTNQDLSAAANGAWRTLEIDNITITGQTAPTVATITSTSVDVRGAASVTVLYDITGATSGVVIGIWGGISGFSMINLRTVTASAGGHGFRLANATTGAAQDTTGVSRVDDLRIQVSLSANSGASTGVTTTVRTRFLTQPST